MRAFRRAHNHHMLTEFSNQLADVVAAVAPSVVQVQGRRWRTASGVVYAPGVVVTTIKALGREDGLHVRGAEGDALDAELAGWDPATGLALLKASGLNAPAIGVAKQPARVGHIGLALARSWSNNLTASAGIVSIIGGPLRTGRRHSIDRVIRTTAPMHDGFAGGAFLDASGALIGVATASTIRGLGVVIPSDIAWKAARGLLEHGRVKSGYIGIAGQQVQLPEGQRAGGRDEALLVIGVSSDGPAAKAGVMVGDVIVSFDGQPVTSPDDLLDVLTGERIGKAAAVGIIRGGTAQTVSVTVGERGAS
ncbi:MAG: signal protein PDZ [Acidobacteria bacterium]|nr:MAG: signal protein PDZ [Acidobacteriota bacterium]